MSATGPRNAHDLGKTREAVGLTTAVAALRAALGVDIAPDLAGQADTLSIAGGQVLFTEGEEADALYVVVSGAVGISARDGAAGVRRLARLGPPETIGELAFLLNAPRTATATALRDSVLLRLSRAAFDDVVTRSPEATLRIARLLAGRVRSASASRRPIGARPVTFAILPVTEGVSAPDLAHGLAPHLGGRSLVLDAWPDDCDEGRLHAIESEHRHVLYTANDAESAWGRLCRRRADHLILLASPGQRPLAVQTRFEGSTWTRQDLVVLQEPDAAIPQAIPADLSSLGENGLCVHVRAGAASDLAQLARLVTGRALGLVLSGGGARGFAHLGALRALAEAGIAVDLVGGTSIGAVIAAAHAMGWAQEEIADRVVDAFVSTPPLNDYTLPLVALTRGLKVDRSLAKHFGDTRIEALWRPFFCVSSNLSTGTAMVHRQGPLAPALRASIAIPGLLPPVLTSDGVLVDGAMINNLPVDVMADLDRGRVLAVDVAGDAALIAPARRGWRSRLLRRWFGVPDLMPGVTEILLRAATVSSDVQAGMTRARASVVIRPPLAEVDLRAWRSHEAIARIGYDHTCRMIEAGILRDLQPEIA